MPSAQTMNLTATTLEEIFHLVLPVGTELLTPDANLRVSVSWACSSRPSPPAFPTLEGGELALINMEDLRVFEASGDLGNVISRLREAAISGVAAQGRLSRNARETAVRESVPLFAIPDGVSLLQVERDIIRLIVDRSAYVLQRASDLQRDLNQITLDGGGQKAIAAQIHHVTNQPFLVLDDAGHIVTAAGAERARGGIASLQAALPNVMRLRSWAVGKSGEELANSVETWELEDRFPLRDCNRVAIGAVVAAERIQGYCMLLRRTGDPPNLSPIEEMAIVQGAAAVALDWVTRNAVGAAEERMRASFLDELLGSNIADEQAWIRRGRSLGYALDQPHVAWMVEAQGLEPWPDVLFTALARRNFKVLSSSRDQSLLLYLPVDPEGDESNAAGKQLAQDLVEDLTRVVSDSEIHIGIGNAVHSLSAWLQSQQQAWECLRANKRWGSSSVTQFEDLGLYRYLTALRSFPETEHFYQSTLVDLIAYDNSHKAGLMQTLDAFFACHGNISQTAAYLQVHRNTLTYRLNHTITQIDLEEADARFGLQLALKLRNLYV